MALDMEAVKHILSKPTTNTQTSTQGETDGDAKLAPVDNLHDQNTRDVFGKDQLSALAKIVGLDSTVRWKPRQVRYAHT